MTITRVLFSKSIQIPRIGTRDSAGVTDLENAQISFKEEARGILMVFTREQVRVTLLVPWGAIAGVLYDETPSVKKAADK